MPIKSAFFLSIPQLQHQFESIRPHEMLKLRSIFCVDGAASLEPHVDAAQMDGGASCAPGCLIPEHAGCQARLYRFPIRLAPLCRHFRHCRFWSRFSHCAAVLKVKDCELSLEVDNVIIMTFRPSKITLLRNY